MLYSPRSKLPKKLIRGRSESSVSEDSTDSILVLRSFKDFSQCSLLSRSHSLRNVPAGRGTEGEKKSDSVRCPKKPPKSPSQSPRHVRIRRIRKLGDDDDVDERNSSKNNEIQFDVWKNHLKSVKDPQSEEIALNALIVSYGSVVNAAKELQALQAAAKALKAFKQDDRTTIVRLDKARPRSASSLRDRATRSPRRLPPIE